LRFEVHLLDFSAELYGEDKTSIALTPSKADPLVLEGAMQPTKSQKYRLHLVDAQDRADKQPPWFKVTVLGDQPPKVEVVFPKRDLAVSPLQEMPLEAKVWDDIAVQRAGAVFMLGKETREVSLSDKKLAGKQNHALKTMLEMEKLKAQPRQMVSYYVWAEDTAPQGGTRRTQSDMFFAEVRHFEDIFREGEAPPGEGKEPKSSADKLAQLQKQIVNADWRVVRDVAGGKTFDQVAGDIGTLLESQEIARQQTEAVLGKTEDAEVRAALRDAAAAMKEAATTLQQGLAAKDAKTPATALNPERVALEALARAQSREHRIMRSQQPSKAQTASEQQQEKQLMQLELKQQEKRYEEEKAAGEEQTQEQQENLQVLNRLKELARRQEALAEKIKEVEQQLAQAKTEEQRKDLEQQLKRLQEEQEQLLRDLDALQERMEQPENQQNMAQEREKLEAAREQVQQAAEQLAQQKTSAAANAATRAQKDIEQVRDEFRERTAKRFSEEMKQLKQDAADVAQSEEKLSEALGKRQEPRRSSDSAVELRQQLEEAKLARQVETQRESLEKLMQHMQQLSDQAEQSEPLLSTALNDAARRAQADGIDASLEEARMQMRFGSNAEAQAAERKAAKGVEDLQKGVEKAAEGVLGSETEALRMARHELDRLLHEVNKDGPQGEKAATKEGAKSPGDDEAKPGEEPHIASSETGKESPTTKPQPGSKPSSEAKEGKGATPLDTPSNEGAMAEKTPQAAQQPTPGQPSNEATQPGQQKGQGRSERSPVGQQASTNGQRPVGGDTRATPGAQEGWFFDQQEGADTASPLTGANYDDWSDRLRRVEESLTTPDLRNEAGRVLDSARQMRVDWRRNNAAPQEDIVRMHIVQPLAELRNRVTEELAKRESRNPLSPLDRDPVPARYRELVRRYYSELGGGD
ncbi:MAG: hypothetical protein ACOYMN_11250, partial [Roseimicrobium sp.]